jgi:hypothetical protein
MKSDCSAPVEPSLWQDSGSAIAEKWHKAWAISAPTPATPSVAPEGVVRIARAPSTRMVRMKPADWNQSETSRESRYGRKKPGMTAPEVILPGQNQKFCQNLMHLRKMKLCIGHDGQWNAGLFKLSHCAWRAQCAGRANAAR